MNGLSSQDVLKSRELHGSNKLPEPPIKKWWEFAKDATIGDRTISLLLILAAIQFVLAVLGVLEFSEPFMIAVVVGICTSLGIKMNLGIQKSTLELKAKTALRYCDVIRDGKVQTINREDLVVGDLVCVGMGQEIFADGYLVEGKISVNNAAINGETKECIKTPVPNYQHVKTTSTSAYTNQNCLFSGTTVMSGEGKMIVTDVGINTVNGDTLVKMQTLEAPKTALDIALDNLCDFISKWGTIAAVIAFAVLTITGIASVGFREYFDGGMLGIVHKFAQNFSVALTIIVAAVPEGLPLIVKLVTKQNVKIMEAFNILAKNPGKIPELAYVDLICTDKTGTLTTGVMTPKVVIDAEGNEVDKASLLWSNIEANICLNNSATFDSENNITGGNSIDRAVLSLVDVEKYTEVCEKFPAKLKQVFNSENKYSAFTCNDGITYYKGAPEKLIEHCTDFLNMETVCKFNDKTALYEKIKSMTEKSMRCIALTVADHDLEENKLPDDMTFLGIIGVVDPVRDEVPNAVKVAHEAGIQVIEITGDCIETAKAVAAECGIYKDGDVALTNDEFEAMSDDEVKEVIPSLRVISRCSPNTKLRLVTLAQEIGRSVAMTGDGVNDSPALKRADVGFGMQSGSDVAKEASDIILTDDNFASVVKAVELGRTFMHNIMMFLEFQLPINISLLILSVIYPMFAAGAALLASVQILIVNIIMDSLNSLSFGGEPPKDEYMTEKPIKKGSGLFIRGAKKRITLSTATFVAMYGIITLSPIARMFATETEAMTARFALLCFMAVFNGFSIRTEHINLFNGLAKNKMFVYIAAGIFVGTILLCNFAENLVKVTALDLNHWIAVIILAFMVIPIDLVRKAVEKVRK